MNFNFNLKKLLQFFLITVAILYIIYYLYRRLSLKNEKFIVYFFLNQPLWLILIVLVLLVGLFYKKYYKISTENKYIISFFNYLHQIYYTPFKELDSFLGKKVHFYVKMVQLCAESIDYFYERVYFTHYLVILFIVIPKMLIPLLFLIEVICTGKLYYTLYALSLLIFSLLWRLYLFYVYDFNQRNLDWLRENAHIVIADNYVYQQKEDLWVWPYTVELLENPADPDATTPQIEYYLDLIIPRLYVYYPPIYIFTSLVNSALFLLWLICGILFFSFILFVKLGVVVI